MNEKKTEVRIGRPICTGTVTMASWPMLALLLWPAGLCYVRPVLVSLLWSTSLCYVRPVLVLLLWPVSLCYVRPVLALLLWLACVMSGLCWSCYYGWPVLCPACTGPVTMAGRPVLCAACIGPVTMAGRPVLCPACTGPVFMAGRPVLALLPWLHVMALFLWPADLW